MVSSMLKTLYEENAASMLLVYDFCFYQLRHPAAPSEDAGGCAAPTSSRPCRLPRPAQPHWRQAAGQQGKLGAQPPSPFQTGSPLCHQP